MSEQSKLSTQDANCLTTFDTWLQDGGPAALVIREPLEPVEGPEGVFFPATFAPEQGTDPERFRGGYYIDSFPDGTNVCLIDSVGSQGNRIEPVFARAKHAGLIPQISIKISDTKRVSLLEAGHRSGDALVRCSELKTDLDSAFKALLDGNAKPLALIAPTSLVFGVWDSRGTQAKSPRLVTSTIRAFNVRRLRRSATYIPPVDYSSFDVFTEEEKAKAEGDKKNVLAQRGFVHVPATGTHGGVKLMQNGCIRRDATLSLAALRRLTVLNHDSSINADETLAMRRYVLGLALIALTAEQDAYLRQGCNLVPASEGADRTFQLVCASGKRIPVVLGELAEDEHLQADSNSPKRPVLSAPTVMRFATLAAKQFGIDPNRDLTKWASPDREVWFDKELAKQDIKGDSEKLKGEVVSVDADNNKLVLRIGKKGDQKDVEIRANEDTAYLKGKDASTFDAMIVAGAKLDIEVANGVATKVIGKK